MKGFKICPNCKGNGFTKHTFEAEKVELQCKACDSMGEISEDKFVSQTYDDINWLGKPSTTYYQGPPLDYRLFNNLRIVVS
jgi:hypothetical protein|tara:strand:+ start:1101 stop:1343 length:243 start_codon:yes stop_codon:yes gene_type:complete